MKKYIFTNTGEEVTIIPEFKPVIPQLIYLGIIKEVPEDTVAKDIEYYINKLAKRYGWKPEKMANYLNTLMDINPMAVVSIVLKAIAISLDKKYPDHISKSEHIYIISVFDGSVREVNKEHIKTYNHFAAFRTEEDALTARNILSDQFAMLFNE